MDSSSISPEEFRKLQIQVDILQRFLTKTFGSSFLEFCKETQLSLTKGSGKSLPHLNKAQNSANATLNNKKAEVSITTNTTATRSSNGSSNNRRPPPLLHRPSGAPLGSAKSGAIAKQDTSSKLTAVKNTAVVVDDTNGEQDFYYDEGNDEDVQFIQPETVFSDEEHAGPSPKKTNNSNSDNKHGLKRGHATAFGYEDAGGSVDNGMHLPEGTECIVINSDEDQGQQESFTLLQQDDIYGDMNNGDEMFDEEGYSYSMVEDGLEITGANGDGGNFQSEELQTDGNVTFGTVITAQDTGIQYFQCAFCPSAKVFKHKQSLKEHYLLNHSPTPPAFQCQCGRRFLKMSQLKRHEVVHTAERPYVCPICFKDFTRKDNMTVHMVRNHAEKKHACPYCPDKVYATPAEVNRHLRMYHSQWQQ